MESVCVWCVRSICVCHNARGFKWNADVKIGRMVPVVVAAPWATPRTATGEPKQMTNELNYKYSKEKFNTTTSNVYGYGEHLR